MSQQMEEMSLGARASDHFKNFLIGLITGYTANSQLTLPSDRSCLAVSGLFYTSLSLLSFYPRVMAYADMNREKKPSEYKRMFELAKEGSEQLNADIQMQLKALEAKYTPRFFNSSTIFTCDNSFGRGLFALGIFAGAVLAQGATYAASIEASRDTVAPNI